VRSKLQRLICIHQRHSEFKYHLLRIIAPKLNQFILRILDGPTGIFTTFLHAQSIYKSSHRTDLVTEPTESRKSWTCCRLIKFRWCKLRTIFPSASSLMHWRNRPSVLWLGVLDFSNALHKNVRTCCRLFYRYKASLSSSSYTLFKQSCRHNSALHTTLNIKLAYLLTQDSTYLKTLWNFFNSSLNISGQNIPEISRDKV